MNHLLPHLDFVHIIVTSMLVAIIWIIQVLHYPTFRFIDSDKEMEFHRFHTFSISPIVAPLMVLELVIVSLNIYLDLSTFTLGLFTLVIIIWLSTFLIQVPIHKRLSIKYKITLVNRLIRTNWIRTICWTVKLLIMIIYRTN